MGFRKRKPLQGCIFAFGIILILCFALARLGAGSGPHSSNPRVSRLGADADPIC